MHGGAHGSGAPKGQRNGMWKHGLFTAEAVAELRAIRKTISESHRLVEAASSILMPDPPVS